MSDAAHRFEPDYDQLIRGYYGEASERALRMPAGARVLPADIEALMASHYGAPLRAPHGGQAHVPRSVTLSMDDGEVLPSAAQPYEEYVVPLAPGQRAAAMACAGEDDYIGQPDRAQPAPATDARADVLQENRTDILAPLAADGAAAAPVAAAAPAAPAAPVYQKMPAPASEPQSVRPDEDDFMADMQAILSGKKMFDPASKKTVSKEAAPPAENAPVMHGTDSKYPQAIFDKIAQSMQFANSYDLGTVEIDSRFADFDRSVDQQQRSALVRRASKAAPAAPATAPVGTADFIRDMDALRAEQGTPAAADSAVHALDVAASAELTGPFVSAALQTLFANAGEINQYFANRGALDFISWFNANLANRGAWAGKAIGTGAGPNFRAIWDRIAQLFGSAQINLLQFASLMSIFINEVGASLAPVSERVGSAGHPGLAYAFDSIASIPKVSYNDGGSNQTAYQCFRNADFIAAHGQKAGGSRLANTTDTRWAGHVWPEGEPTDVNPAITGFIMEADFYKFRGRGMIQTTWRDAYERLIAFVQGYAGTQAEILSRQQSWAGMTTAKAAHVSSNADWDALFRQTDLEIACVAVAQHSAGSGNYLNLSGDVHVLNGTGNGSIWKMGKRISGGTSYANLFRSRVIAMCNLLGNGDA